jgi:hypothetical protein
MGVRSRNIKPSFFTNELLAECSPLGRLLFAGLWCAADRRGLLEDRPRRLKAELLPYDDVDVDALLTELHEHGFIYRYMNDDGRYIWIPAFTKHQHPHQNERASQIVAPDDSDACTGAAPERSGGFPLTDSLLLKTDPPTTSTTSSRARAQDVDDSDDDAVASDLDEIVETLSRASFVTGAPDQIARLVVRSYALVSAFDTSAALREAELFTRWSGYQKRPPADWYRAWIHWIKRAAEQEQSRASTRVDRTKQDTEAERRAHRDRHLAMGVFKRSQNGGTT